MSIIKKLNNRLAADGVILGSWHLLARVFRNARSFFYGLVLGAENLDIGSGCYIKGIKRIRFGKDISIFKDIWLEAVTQHHGVRFTPLITLGARISFSNNVHVSCINRVSIGDDVLIGSNVHISDHNHGHYGVEGASTPDVAPAARLLKSAGEVVIGDRVWIGDNVVIIGPVRIGAGAVIGANSVVRTDIPENSVAVGVPTRVVKVFNPVDATWIRP
jgi:lipopolysaccharide O-acetyltransferase